MYIQLNALRIDRDNCEQPCGKVIIRKDQIAAVASIWAFNQDKPKNSYYRGNTQIHLTSGTVLPVMDNVKDVEKMLLAE